MKFNTENIQYKIKKYTYKLRKANSLKSAEVYQNKLRYYHAINQYGGIDVGNYMLILGDMKNKLDNEKKELKKLKKKYNDV
jgi:hypothetical protein